MGKLLSIATKEKTRAPMQEWESIIVDVQEGLEHEGRSHSGNRQVTLVSKEAWDRACTDLGRKVSWLTRRANLLIQGIDLAESTGKHLQIGEVVLEITMETDPCARMEEQEEGLFEALTPEWRGGVCCRVLEGGFISRGNEVILL